MKRSARRGTIESPPLGEMVETRGDDIRSLADRYGISNVRIFGSVARGDDHSRSDVDFLVDVPRDALLFDLFECYGSVSVSTLLLVGTETPEDDVLTTHRLHAVIPDSRVAESHSQGHMAHLGALELLASEVARFLTTIADT